MTKHKHKNEWAKPSPSIEFKSDTQEIAWRLAEEVDILFLLGTAGSGKTFIASALAYFGIEDGTYTNVQLTRPLVQAGEDIGTLPGEVKDKFSEFVRPVTDNLSDIMPKGSDFAQRYIKLAPLAFIQGRTFKHSLCIFDEAQNATYEQLKTYLSRLGEGSKMILTADPSQVYIRNSGFMEVVNKLDRMREVGIVQFKHVDVVRHKTVAKVLQRLD